MSDDGDDAADTGDGDTAADGDDVIGRFRAPVAAVERNGTTRWVIRIDAEERALVVRLLGEIRDLLLAGDAPDGSTPALLQRLFPPAFLEDPDKEEEYQRLMREELVASRLAQIESVSAFLGPDGPDRLDEEQIVAFMQSINAVRIVLGTMLDVSEDDDLDPELVQTGEHQLYGYLSWLLDWTVRSMTG